MCIWWIDECCCCKGGVAWRVWKKCKPVKNQTGPCVCCQTYSDVPDDELTAASDDYDEGDREFVITANMENRVFPREDEEAYKNRELCDHANGCAKRGRFCRNCPNGPGEDHNPPFDDGMGPRGYQATAA